MRVVILPVISFPRVWSESEWLMYEKMARTWVERNPDAFVYFVTPDTPDKLPEHPRIRWIVEKWYDSFYDKVAMAGGTFLDLFNPRIGKYQVDAIVTSRTVASTQIARMLWDPRCGEDMMPLFTRELKAVDYGKAHQTLNDLEIVGRSLGYVFSYPIFDTAVDMGVAKDAALRYIQPFYVKKTFDRAFVNPCGIGVRDIDEHTKDVKKHEKFTCFFGGRLNWGSKRAPITLGFMDRFFAFGRDVRVIASSPSGESMKTEAFTKKFASLELFPYMPTQDFWRKAKECHVFVSFSKIEGFTVGVVEMLYMGLIGLLPKSDWVKGLLMERYDDYPFKHGDETECLAIMRYVYENYEKACAQVAWLPEFIRERYNCFETNQREYEYMKTIVGKTRQSYLWSPENTRLMEATVAALGDTFSMQDAWEKLVEISRGYSKTGPARRGQMSRYTFHKWLLSHGYSDTCQEEFPTYVRLAEQRAEAG